MEECMSWGESITFFRCCCSIFLVLDEECARLEIAYPPYEKAVGNITFDAMECMGYTLKKNIALPSPQLRSPEIDYNQSQ
jgi:hypothetical protein